MANDTPYEKLQRLRVVAREFGKPVGRIPTDGAMEGRIARLEKTVDGGLRAIVVGERYVAVIGLKDNAQWLVGKQVRLENNKGAGRIIDLEAREQSVDRARER